MDEQDRVSAFLDDHDLRTDPAYHALDLAAEVGEIAADVNDSTDYGARPDAAAVPRDELGDALFALLATCDTLGVDAGEALTASLEKYERRIDRTGDAGSGE